MFVTAIIAAGGRGHRFGARLKQLVAVAGEPVLARAGNDQPYLLVFKNVAKARQFVAQQSPDPDAPTNTTLSFSAASGTSGVRPAESCAYEFRICATG